MNCSNHLNQCQIISDEGSLRQKVLWGGVWVFLTKGLVRFADFIKFAVLARLISPADFGLMGIALFVLGCLETFTETGYTTALIQKQGDIRPYLDTTFTIQALRGA